jgi:hypothetical protein
MAGPRLALLPRPGERLSSSSAKGAHRAAHLMHKLSVATVSGAWRYPIGQLCRAQYLPIRGTGCGSFYGVIIGAG